MAISDESTEVIKNRKEQRGLKEQMADAREKAALSAFEANARNGDTVDVVDILPSGEVSEQAGEGRDRKGDPAASTGSAPQQDDQQMLAALAAKAEPEPQEMAKEVKREIRKELRTVRTEVHHLSKDPAGNAFELTQSIDLLRKLKTLLAEIAFRSAEYIRNLWLAISHGQKVSELV